MLAQLNLTVGAIEDNCDKVLAAAAQADQQGADLLVCSELALTGYPPEDLLLRTDLMVRVRGCAVLHRGMAGTMCHSGGPSLARRGGALQYGVSL